MLVNIRPHTTALHHTIRNKNARSKNEIESLNGLQEQNEQDPTDRCSQRLNLTDLPQQNKFYRYKRM